MADDRLDERRGHGRSSIGHCGRQPRFVAFGLDSVIELASAGALIWRLTVELRRGQAFSESAEQLASRIAGGLLFVLAACVTIAALWSLWTRQGEAFSWPGFIVALAAIPSMRYLARRKIAIADKIGSRALSADAMEAVTCGWLLAVVVVRPPDCQIESGGVPRRFGL